MFTEVKALYLLALGDNGGFSIVWVPRGHEMLRAADEPSKWQDKSDGRFLARSQGSRSGLLVSPT